MCYNIVLPTNMREWTNMKRNNNKCNFFTRWPMEDLDISPCRRALMTIFESRSKATIQAANVSNTTIKKGSGIFSERAAMISTTLIPDSLVSSNTTPSKFVLNSSNADTTLVGCLCNLERALFGWNSIRLYLSLSRISSRGTLSSFNCSFLLFHKDLKRNSYGKNHQT